MIKRFIWHLKFSWSMSLWWPLKWYELPAFIFFELIVDIPICLLLAGIDTVACWLGKCPRACYSCKPLDK